MENNTTITISSGILTLCQTYDAEITIPEGVHTIAEGALKGNAGLRKVVLPSTLKTIGAAAFKGCRQLHDIQFPDGLEEVGDYAFNRCHAIEELIFPKVDDQDWRVCVPLLRQPQKSGDGRS